MADEQPGTRRVVVPVVGDLDLATAEALVDQVVTVLAGEVDTVVVDLAEVDFLGSSGIGALIAARNRALDRGARIVLRRPSRRVSRLLEITGIDAVFPVEHG